MKKIYLAIIILFLALIGFFYFRHLAPKNIPPQTPPAVENISPPTQSAAAPLISAPAKPFTAPLPNAQARITKKPFGVYITPKNSPVQPERFQGFHTGTDFEIFPEELNAAVPVKTICAGKLLLKKSATGYGGVAVESCELNNQPVTVIYGHLKLISIASNVRDNLNAGDILGILGADKSAETDGERKHLHLGIYKGTSINILGYVQSQAELSGWFNPEDYLDLTQ